MRDLILNRPHHIILSDQDRRQHILLSGLPSTGVTTYMLDLLYQDLYHQTPLVLFDPYGDIADRMLAHMTEGQLAQTAYIDVGNKEFPIGMNIFEGKDSEERREIVNTIVDLLYALYDPQRTGIIGPRFENAVRNAILTILYDESSTILEIVRCLTDISYVNALLPKITDPFVKNYWTKQIAQTSDFHKSEVLDYIVSKFSKFVSDTAIRNIVGQTESTIHFQSLLAKKKCILFDISKLRNDPEGIRIMYEIIMHKLLKALEHRAEKEMISVYIDEIYNYPTHRIHELLQSARKNNLTLTMTTQRISDLDASLRKEVLKSGTLLCFRLSTDNAQVFAPEFHTSTLNVDHLCMQKRFHMSVKTLSNGNPVVFETVNSERPGIEMEKGKGNTQVIKASFIREYGRDRQTVEKEINARIEQ